MSCAQLQEWAGDHKKLLDGGALVVCALLLAVAAFSRSRPRRAAVCAVALGAVLALAMSLDDFLHAWDERFHALAAKNLIAHPLTPTLYEHTPLPASLDWVSCHVFLHKPPLTLWLIGASLRLVGSCELAVRLPSVALFGAAIWAVFRIGALLFEPHIGACAAVLFALNGHLLDLASGRQPTDHPDSVLVSLVCIGAWAALEQVRTRRRELALAVGAFVGLAVLTKSFPALLILGLWVWAMPWRDQPRACARDLALGALACAALVLPWEVHARTAFPAQAAWESAYSWRHFLEPLEQHAGGPFFHLSRLPRFFGEASPLAILWFLGRPAAGFARRFVALWFVVPYAVFSLAATKMESYVFIAAPAVDLMVAAAFAALAESVSNLQGARRAAASLLAALLVALPARFAVERWKPFHGFEPERAEARRLRALGRQSGRAALFGVRDPISAMFYGAAAAYAHVPTAEEQRRSEEAGYPVIVGPPDLR